MWLNPPYTDGIIGQWLARLAEHDHGTALIFARTETAAFQRYVFGHASALLFMAGRINFHLPNGIEAKSNAGAPTVLCAYGRQDADILAACEIAGRFVPLRIPKSVLVSLFAASETSATWPELVAEFMRDRDGPVSVDEVYRHFMTHPKAKTNRNVRAKVRQQLQLGMFDRVAPGTYQKRIASQA